MSCIKRTVLKFWIFRVISLQIGLRAAMRRYTHFTGGCNGNLKAIPILVEGMTVEQIEEKLLGVLCGRRPTSCANQLTKAVRAAYEASKSHK